MTRLSDDAPQLPVGQRVTSGSVATAAEASCLLQGADEYAAPRHVPIVCRHDRSTGTICGYAWAVKFRGPLNADGGYQYSWLTGAHFMDPFAPDFDVYCLVKEMLQLLSAVESVNRDTCG